MLKKGAGYLLLCCFLNLLTALPAKCCEGSSPLHESSNKAPGHSLTLIQHLFDFINGDDAGSDNTVDVHYSFFYVTGRHAATLASTQFFSKASCNGAIVAPQATLINYTGYHTRKFTLPPHHNFLFRLTPF